MATRSFIGKLNNDGTVAGIYCHYDGYIDGVGKTLRTHYTTTGKVKKLLALGDLRNLGTTTSLTEAYHRDRGETPQEAIEFKNLDEIADFGTADHGFEFFYVFTGEKDGWLTLERGKGRWLTEAELAGFPVT
jgi:hypothetical protein